ncbi:hypothetical protein ACK8OR_17830 [Jannaschia sp. KMU-145]|uniref:hypothetical protein n=1 Tax=Jannaschia halovivens TaxID=3388667 RepID=UPI00396B23D8
MSGGYTSFDMVWMERVITVSYEANWLRSGHWHIELRCAEPLPLTDTGYRSMFVPEEQFLDEAEIEGFVQWLLDDAAGSVAWKDFLEKSRQLNLF